MLRRSRVVPFVVQLGLVTVACGFEEPPLPARTPVGPDVFLAPDIQVVEDQIPRNSTLASLLASHDMPGDVAYAFVEATRPVFDPRRLKSGNPYKLVYGEEGRFRRFEYHVDDDQFLQVVSETETQVFNAALVDYEKRIEQVSWRTMLGGVLVVGGITLLVLGRS